MNEKYIKLILSQLVDDKLEDLQFYPGNSDGEFIDKKYNEVVYELVDSILEEEPIAIYGYIERYMKINYKEFIK